MVTAPSAKPRREPPPIPPNYVSLRQLQELRLKEEEQEKRQQEEEEAAAKREAALKAEKAAAAKQMAALKAEMAAMAAAVKRDAALKAETKGRTASSGASGGANERLHGEQGHQWVAVAHRPPPLPRGEGAAGKREGAVRARGDKEPRDAAADAHHGGGKPEGKGKKVSARTSAETVDAPGKPAEVAAASSHGGKPRNKGERKANERASGDQTAESDSSGGAGEPAKAAIASSRGRFIRKGEKGAGGWSAEASRVSAPAKTAGAAPPQGIKPENTEERKPPGPRRADASPSSDSSDEKAAPALAPPTSAAEGSSERRSGGELRTTAEPKPEGLVEGHRRPPAAGGGSPSRGRAEATGR